MCYICACIFLFLAVVFGAGHFILVWWSVAECGSAFFTAISLPVPHYVYTWLGSGMPVLRTFCNHESYLLNMDHSYYCYNSVYRVCRGFCVGCLMFSVLQLEPYRIISHQMHYFSSIIQNHLSLLFVLFFSLSAGDSVRHFSVIHQQASAVFVLKFFQLSSDI